MGVKLQISDLPHRDVKSKEAFKYVVWAQGPRAQGSRVPLPSCVSRCSHKWKRKTRVGFCIRFPRRHSLSEREAMGRGPENQPKHRLLILWPWVLGQRVFSLNLEMYTLSNKIFPCVQIVVCEASFSFSRTFVLYFLSFLWSQPQLRVTVPHVFSLVFLFLFFLSLLVSLGLPSPFQSPLPASCLAVCVPFLVLATPLCLQGSDPGHQVRVTPTVSPPTRGAARCGSPVHLLKIKIQLHLSFCGN